MRWLSLALLGLASLAIGVVYLEWAPDAPDSLGATLFGVSYELSSPRSLGFALLGPLLLFVLYKSLADLPWQQRLLSACFRLGFVALLALALSRPVRTRDGDRVDAVFLVDVSDSMPDAALEDARERIARAEAARREGDRLSVVRFASRPQLMSLEGGVEKLALRGGEGPPLETSGTDVQAALQLSYGLFRAGTLRRVALISDGVETRGDLTSEAHRAGEFGVRLFTWAHDRPVPPEVAVKNLEIPAGVKVGQPFSVTASVYSSRPATARARLYQGEMLNGLQGVRQIELEAGDNRIEFRSVVRIGGAVSYRLALDELSEDRFEQNNQFVTSVDVPGQPRVLLVEGQPARATYLASALSAQQFDVDVRSPAALPRTLGELEGFDFFVLSDVPASDVSAGVQEIIERYVRDLGGGLLFAGGESGYTLGRWEHTTVARLLPVSMDSERRREMPGVAMALVIDRSGSMTGPPIEMAKAACRATVETLRGDDLVEVIAFDSRPKRFVKMQPARYQSRIQNELSTIQPGGGTAIFPALDAAYQDISVVQARKKHVILLTDGKAESVGIRDLVGAMIAEGITVTTVGLGDAADADLLRLIAEAGGGRYHHVPDANSLPRIFTRETEMISREAAVQEWFPVVVSSRADFLRGIPMTTAPLLHGYVSTQLKPPPAQQILSSDQGEPILARWRVGLGQVVAWTSDLKNNWAVDWLRWRHFGRFFGQLVREHQKKKDRRQLPMRAELRGDRVRASVDAFDAAGGFDNAIESRLVVTGPLPSEQRREVAMRQVAPGRYEADFRLDAYGSFLLRGEHVRRLEGGATESAGVSMGQVSRAYPREYERLNPNRELLASAALAGGGRFAPSVEELFDPGDERVLTREPLWPPLVLLAMVCFLLDLLMRRVRLFDRGFRRR